MALRIAEKAALTDVGRQRQSNEDAFLERSPLFAVADGMGGARAGEVASKIAVEAFDASQHSDASPEQQLAEVAREANRRIWRMAQNDQDLAGMGTTLVAAMVTGKEIAVSHVGDSRLYRLRDRHLERLTQDHSLVEEFVRQGKLTPEEAEVHPQRSIITRALGPEPEVQVDTYTYPGQPGDVYLICSDGLTGMISEDAVEKILERAPSLAGAARELVDAANENGGKDNITVVLFRIEGDDSDDDEHDTLGGHEQAPVHADSVRSAVAEADGSPDSQTMALGAAEATRERARAAPSAEPVEDAEPAGGVPSTSPLAHLRERRRLSLRTKVTAVLTVLVIAAVIAGLYAGSRQFWFVGTNDRAQVTLYQGLPYDLPFGIRLYSQKYVSSVPALAIQSKRQRDADLDQSLRSKGDASDLVRSLERTYTRP